MAAAAAAGSFSAKPGGAASTGGDCKLKEASLHAAHTTI